MAVVSCFIATGKPKATAERIHVLAQMLHMNAGELIARLVEGKPPGSQFDKTPISPGEENSSLPPQSVEAALDEAKRAVQRLRELMPDARIHFSIDYSDLVPQHSGFD
jgi:hypothetical protein